MKIPTAALVTTGLVGGFEVARTSGRRELGGALFAGLGIAAGAQWWQGGGPARALPLAAVYVASMGGSHPLAKKVGPWPAVAVVTAVSAAAAYALHDRRA